MTINILGTDYNYKEMSPDEDMCLFDKAGYCDSYGKLISINNEYNSNDPNSINDINAFVKKVKRHEIIHAYLCESGLMEYSEDETIVDWISWQYNKLSETFKEIDAI